MRRLIALVLVAGCASAGAPPGGPEDHAPPAIVAITPDSGQTNANPKQVEFRFDEVVSDRPSGATALDQLFLVSPRHGNEAPNVSWHRSRITIKPRHGFLPNTAYRVTMLPGISDLRGNVRKEGASVLFSTGATFPALSILGRVFDWAAQRPANGAYVEAISTADTNIVYLAATDTSGQFDVGPLAAGTYLVRALIDQNANRTLDRNEKWDTTTKTVTDTRPVVELDAIERDSTPAAFADVTVEDSVTVRAAFDKPLDPALPLQPALMRLQRADSSELTVTRVQWASAYERAKQAADSARRAQAADSARRADTTRALQPPVARPPSPAAPTPPTQRGPPPPPKPRAPPPERAIVISVSPSTPLVVGTTYRITARGLRNLVGASSEVRRTFSPPKPVPPDSTKKAPPDSTRRPPPLPGRPPR